MRARIAHQWLLTVVSLGLAAGVANSAGIFEFAVGSVTPGLPISIRAAAMGGASAAVNWGEPDAWANPATLAGVRGVGWVGGRTLELPGLSSEIVLHSQQFLVGGSGLGFSFMGKPISGLGKTRLDLGTYAAPINITGDLFEQTESWGVGLSPLRLVDAYRRANGSTAPSLTSVGDISFGYQSEITQVTSVPSGDLMDEAHTYDWGVLGRVALARLWSRDASMRLNLTAAYSDLNQLRPHAGSLDAPPSRFKRSAVALRLSPPPPSERSAEPPAMPWWRPGDVPSLSLGLAYDHDNRTEFGDGSTHGIDHVGLEATLFQLVALRAGYYSDPTGDVQGMTYGGGVTLPIGPWGSVGYQLASVPIVEGLDRQFRQGWSVWFDPSRFWSGSN